MALHEMYSGVCGTNQYLESHVNIAAFAKSVHDPYGTNRQESEFNLQASAAICFPTIFFQFGGF